MQLPTIPTDNLYKFMALSGLTIILFFSFSLIYFFYKIQLEMIEQRKNANLVKEKTKILGRLKDNHVKYTEILLELRKEKEITKKEFYELQQKGILNFNKYADSILLDININMSNLEVLAGKIIFSIVILIFSGMGVFGGYKLSKKGFNLWYEKLQVYQDRQIKNLNSDRIVYKKCKTL
ncbi:hypothetical protein ACOTVL_04065 [Aliarcobacter butzleri]